VCFETTITKYNWFFTFWNIQLVGIEGKYYELFSEFLLCNWWFFFSKSVGRVFVVVNVNVANFPFISYVLEHSELLCNKLFGQRSRQMSIQRSCKNWAAIRFFHCTVIQVAVHFRSLVCSDNNNCLQTNQNNYHVSLTLFHAAATEFCLDDAFHSNIIMSYLFVFRALSITKHEHIIIIINILL